MRELAQCIIEREKRNWANTAGGPPLLTTGTLLDNKNRTRRYIARNVSTFFAAGYIVEEICEKPADLSDFWQRLDRDIPQQEITSMFENPVPFAEAVAYLTRMDATLRRKAAFDRSCTYEEPPQSDTALDFRLAGSVKTRPARTSILARLFLRP